MSSQHPSDPYLATTRWLSSKVSVSAINLLPSSATENFASMVEQLEMRLYVVKFADNFFEIW
jgi:hypothetical protein